MEEQLTQKDLEDFKNMLMEALCENQEVKNSVKESVPDYLKPYAHINPYAPDALEQIETVTKIMHPETVPAHPAWVQRLIDVGLVDTDGKTVIANSLETVAAAIRDNEGIVITPNHLKRLVKSKDGKQYSLAQIKDVLSTVNGKK